MKQEELDHHIFSSQELQSFWKIMSCGWNVLRIKHYWSYKPFIASFESKGNNKDYKTNYKSLTEKIYMQETQRHFSDANNKGVECP